MDILIIVVCTLFLALLLAALIFKAVGLAKEVKASKEELARIRDENVYLLEIVQGGKTVRVDCVDVNCDNIELVAAGGDKAGGEQA